MTPQAAAGAGLLGAGAVGVGSAYLAGAFDGSGSSEVEMEPTNVLLSSEDNFSSVYPNAGLIGKEYGNYLVSPIGSKTKEKVTIDNKKWWEWSYKRWKKDFENQQAKVNLSNEFKDGDKVSKAFSDSTTESDSSTALNRVCESVYKKDKSLLAFEPGTTDNKIRLKNDLFKYCSIFGELKTIGEVSTETYEDNTKGKVDANIKKFIATTGNDKFWAKRNEEFYAGAGDKSKSQATGSSSKFKTKSAGNPKPEIKEICREAYESNTSGDNGYPDDEVSRFCTL
ncbi:hypothetical protein [Candidatus Mycoplasma haematohominis]|uniref:hypothetical protein n=1 Tax=Candidatus Mycoplasma haematohominis TaxID=1494318 RepID=UPI001C0A712D|nr:hypothetical protein [Candidatus Mycoplasma haemohominis]